MSLVRMGVLALRVEGAVIDRATALLAVHNARPWATLTRCAGVARATARSDSRMLGSKAKESRLNLVPSTRITGTDLVEGVGFTLNLTPPVGAFFTGNSSGMGSVLSWRIVGSVGLRWSKRRSTEPSSPSLFHPPNQIVVLVSNRRSKG